MSFTTLEEYKKATLSPAEFAEWDADRKARSAERRSSQMKAMREAEEERKAAGLSTVEDHIGVLLGELCERLATELDTAMKAMTSEQRVAAMGVFFDVTAPLDVAHDDLRGTHRKGSTFVPGSLCDLAGKPVAQLSTADRARVTALEAKLRAIAAKLPRTLDLQGAMKRAARVEELQAKCDRDQAKVRELRAEIAGLAARKAQLEAKRAAEKKPAPIPKTNADAPNVDLAYEATLEARLRAAGCFEIKKNEHGQVTGWRK